MLLLGLVTEMICLTYGEEMDNLVHPVAWALMLLAEHWLFLIHSD